MPYDKNEELPDSVKDNLPEHAQEIYRKAFNSAWGQYKDSEEREARAHQVAWSAVKQAYEKDEDSGGWEKK
ncbi:MAG: ChaB family protein [Anaerolineae bacterium]|jgi:cation transport regulator